MKKMILQRVLGLIMLVISVMILLITKDTGEDASALLITVPVAVALLFSKQYILNV